MKRLYTTVKYKRLMRRRQLRQLWCCRRHKRAKSQTPTKRLPPFIRLLAPERFSLLENPEEAIPFLQRMHVGDTRGRLFVDLTATQFLTCDACAVLAATTESDLCKAQVFGNWPDDPNARQILIDSGFQRRMKTVQPLPDPEYGTIMRQDIYLDKVDTRVTTDLAKQVVDFAKNKLCRIVDDKPSYGILVDVMENTFTHASAVMTGQVSWWATIYCDLARSKACYCFVDLGIGIFRSKSFQQRIRYVARSLMRGPTDKMRALLSRKIPSRTGLPYRGRGLPWIYESGLEGRIESLTIISNNVFARPLQDDYRVLSHSFHGTFLYWET